MDFLQEIGVLALGSRLRRLSDQLMAAGGEIYEAAEIDFEPRWFPLFRLLAAKGPLSVGEAASALGLTHAAISQTARAMSRRGVLSSRKDANDERRRLLSLSERGADMIPRLETVWADLERAVRQMVDFGGIDILAAIDGVEQAAGRHGLDERYQRLRRARQLEQVEIIPFSPRLRDDFRRLNVEWLEKYFTVEPVDEQVFANPQRIVDDGGAIFFARIGEEVVGTCALLRSEGSYEVAKMAVTPRYQGRHIGKKLLEAAVARARAVGAPSVFLYTNSSLVPAVSLYRSSGFRITHSGPSSKYERGDLKMELDLMP